MSTKRKKLHLKKTRRGAPVFTAGLRSFKTGDKIWWEVPGDERPYRDGLVICMQMKDGAVRVQDQWNGEELWLKNSQPNPGYHEKAW